MGLVGVITSLFMLVFILNIVPDRNSDVREGRSALAEAIAVYSTALVKTAKSQRLRYDFNLLAERNKTCSPWRSASKSEICSFPPPITSTAGRR
jgi:hypothetical protein